MKLSIITICFNDLDGLKKTVESVRIQTFKDYEFLIIDGDSTDGTKDYLLAQSSTVTQFVSEKDSGIYDAMNKGIKLAKGEYCLFLNSGDFLADAQVLNDVFTSKWQADICYGNMFIDDANGTRRLGLMPRKLTTLHMLEDTLWHPASFILRSLFDKYGAYDESIRMAADYDFFLKVVTSGKVTTHYLNRAITVFNLSGMSSKPENRAALLKERELIQQRYFSAAELANAAGKIKLRRTLPFRILRKIGLIS
jgi:glycosyltransferase involved in cell wall biosynthesis